QPPAGPLCGRSDGPADVRCGGGDVRALVAMISGDLMKMIFLLIGLALLLVIAILSARAATVKSRQIQAPPVKDPAIDAPAAAERLAGGIRLPAVSHAG